MDLQNTEEQYVQRLRNILSACLNFDIDFPNIDYMKRLISKLLMPNVKIKKQVRSNIINVVDNYFEQYLRLESIAIMKKQGRQFGLLNSKRMKMLLIISNFSLLMIKKHTFEEANYIIARLENDISDLNLTEKIIS